MQNLVIFYFIIGMIYTIINGWVRKLDNDDWTLTYVWFFGWPICFICLIIDKMLKLKK